MAKIYKQGRSEDFEGLNHLNQPRGRSRRPQISSEQIGHWSEAVARRIGSWGFIALMTVVVAGWVLWNYLAPEHLHFDEFPFIFLTLILSLQASYAAPLILLAQNRQSDRDRVQYQEDRLRTERLLADTDYLAREIASLRLSIGEVATRDFIRGELRENLTELNETLTQKLKALQEGETARGSHGSNQD